MEGGGRLVKRPGRPALAALAVLCLAMAATGGVAAAPGSDGRKVLVLGLDGLDPRVLEPLMESGQMPHFSALAARGDYSNLQTVTPPQSPVAWATVITGMDPGGHAIFDFIHRDPITMLPEFSAARVELPERSLNLGVCTVPLDSGKVELLRDGVAFWQILDEHGVPSTVLKMPSNFPPVETEAESLSGMGTPDLLGTYGTFHFFTDDPAISQADVSGGGEVHRVTVDEGRVDAKLPGPDNTWKENEDRATLPLTVFVDPAREVVRVDIAGEKLLLAEGEWSDWVQVKFTLCPLVATVQGIVRFHLVQAHPRLMLYASPVNIDPTSPALPISTPADFAGEIAEGIGLYYTQGMAEDTMALSSGIFADEDFMQQVGLVLEEENRMMDWALDRFEDGFLYVYFSAADLVQHMMWRAMDPEHPMWSPRLQEAHGDAIASVYRNLDAALGRAVAKVGDEALVLAISDHGFAPFYREVNLNTWLKDRGYLVLKDPTREAATQFLSNVDWGRTRAYGLGFNGLYLNRRGRAGASWTRARNPSR